MRRRRLRAVRFAFVVPIASRFSEIERAIGFKVRRRSGGDFGGRSDLARACHGGALEQVPTWRRTKLTRLDGLLEHPLRLCFGAARRGEHGLEDALREDEEQDEEEVEDADFMADVGDTAEEATDPTDEVIDGEEAANGGGVLVEEAFDARPRRIKLRFVAEDVGVEPARRVVDEEKNERSGCTRSPIEQLLRLLNLIFFST